MARWAYVNGQYVPRSMASVSIEDRGYQFADGIYEVCLVLNGKFWDLDGHLARMEYSLGELSIAAPMSSRSLLSVMDELLKRNRLTNALVYIQVTRGVWRRNHVFPPAYLPSSLVMTASRFCLDDSDERAAKGVSVITQPDIRWGRADIKTISLLPNVLAKQVANSAGASEVWLMRDGIITEGGASNAWIIDKKGALITHPKSHEILGGITRQTVLACAADMQIPVFERSFTLDEALGAQEAFLTSATNLVMPVVQVDAALVGRGEPGPVTTRLRAAYKERAKIEAESSCKLRP